MAEYIERGALRQFPIRRNHYDRKNGNKHFINGIESVLEYAEQLPTVDAEDVVRCKDCKHRIYKRVNDWIGEIGGCGIFDYPMPDDFFCSYGERRASDGE